MSEIMRPLPFHALMAQVLSEIKNSGAVFGIRPGKFYRNSSGNKTALFGSEIDSPVGPAAGPNSQLAQNILAAYLSGSRFIELKTVQTMDGEELRNCVARPCINAEDECYNVEWSTELTVQEAFDEYVKAWFLVYVLGIEYGLGTGVLFNMSVGYSYEGICSKKIDDYIEGLRYAADTPVWKECREWLEANIGGFDVFTLKDLAAIPTKVSDSITLSTLHGCPADEIEKIAHYLITEKNMHTFIKCNPTLLGYKTARDIMDRMGYGYVSFDDHHFIEDLQFEDAAAMIGRLKETASERGLSFGVKITNTFPVDIKRGELPGEEMYMSGRALFPLSMTVAAKIAEATGGRVPISYSGGAESFNIEQILNTGIRPVTMATGILKPGGYERIKQIAEIAENCRYSRSAEIDVKALKNITAKIEEASRHKKSYRQAGSRKTDKSLPFFDCASAPCANGGCPINQQIPAYLEQVAKQDLAKAFEIIVNDNALPSVTGAICDHQCQSKCTRLDYDDPLMIRSAKKFASESAQDAFTKSIKESPLASGAKALVVGAGPAGIGAAVYLRRNGIDVTVREKSGEPLGIVSRVIPEFRISGSELALDVKMAEAYGVRFEFNAPADYDIAELKREYNYVVLATGAWLEGKSNIPVDGKNVMDALEFLEASKKSNCKATVGKKVAIIGGGDVAMDCARAAARNEGVDEAVIVYRRTKEFMPAQNEEIELAVADGVKFTERRSPLEFEGGKLTCEKMSLGDYDASGRRSVFASGGTETLTFDTVISATGARVDTSLFSRNGIAIGNDGYAVLSDSNETSIPGVYIAGDCKTGPKTVVKALADAKAIALDILSKENIGPDFRHYEIESCRDELIAKKGIQIPSVTDMAAQQADAERCLSCGKVCEICADVCPNRANVVIDMKNAFMQRYQIVHIDRMCNECGNCGVFCPDEGNPYKDKITIFATEADFLDSTNRGFLKRKDGSYRVRLEDGTVTEYAGGTGGGSENPVVPAFINVISRVSADYGYLLG